ncbi:Scr1 family TA system antitoxin-like transcriptional regulator [Streptomyces sp. NPDC059506]|uniref:helix-turn-helix domain-containing protein n=1 Tax=Streptomyces TaxID=1883 RepID=UPI002E7AF0FC|nr:helix-turn-helix transcriptional regulator [Streptomyces sp. HB2AG]
MVQNSDLGSATLKYFGSQLKLFRQRAGLTREQLGAQVGYSEAMVAAIEQGRRFPQQELIDRADEALDAGGVLKAGGPYLVRCRYPTWFHDFALLEADAVSRNSYDCQAVPGLLQTEAYARAVLSSYCPALDDDEIDGRVKARLDRQVLLTRKPAPTLSFVIEEVVLHRPIGGRATMREQLQRLLECARLRNVSVQIMPTAQEAHTGLDGPMVLLETAERRTVGYVEGQSGSFLMTDRDNVGALVLRYGTLRGQALNPGESANLIEQVAGEL